MRVLVKIFYNSQQLHRKMTVNLMVKLPSTIPKIENQISKKTNMRMLHINWK